jgi:hypothetical protein
MKALKLSNTLRNQAFRMKKNLNTILEGKRHQEAVELQIVHPRAHLPKMT